MARKPRAVSAEVRDRIAQAATEARDAEEAWKVAIERRDKIIVEAVDMHGMAQLAIADAAGVAKGRISAILASSQPGVGE